MSCSSAASRVTEVGLAVGPPRRHLADDRDRVGQHVLVALDRVLLQPQRRDLGKELGEQTGVVQEPQPGSGVLDEEQLVELVADPLGRHDLHPVAQPSHRVDDHRLGLEPVAGDEAGRPHHPQRIVGEGLVG